MSDIAHYTVNSLLKVILFCNVSTIYSELKMNVLSTLGVV